MKIAGLDIGTTGCKCTVFSPEGLALCRAYRDYPAVRGEGGHEIDAAAVMTQVYAVLAEAAAQHPDIAGVGVTSFGESFVLAGADGAPLRPTLLYTDPRGAAECQALSQRLGDRRIAAVTGLRPHEMYSLPKIMWVMRHEPQVWRAVKTIHLIQDYAIIPWPRAPWPWIFSGWIGARSCFPPRGCPGKCCPAPWPRERRQARCCPIWPGGWACAPIRW